MTPISAYGYPVSPYEINEDTPPVEAVLPDDRIVLLTGWSRIRVGAAGTGESTIVSEFWDWEEERQGIKGIYKLIKAIPVAVKIEAKRRKSNHKTYKQFLKNMEFLGLQCLEDDELSTEILKYGVNEWLKGG